MIGANSHTLIGKVIEAQQAKTHSGTPIVTLILEVPGWRYQRGEGRKPEPRLVAIKCFGKIAEEASSAQFGQLASVQCHAVSRQMDRGGWWTDLEADGVHCHQETKPDAEV